MSDIETRLKHLLDSNDPPLPLDILVINESIDFLDSYLQELQKAIGKVKKQRRRCVALLCGIRRLPPELLSEIFVHAASEKLPNSDSRSDSNLYPASRDLPFVFSRVCRRWREIALSTPALWSCITLVHRTPAAQTKYSGLVNRCLEKSSFSPLYITLSAEHMIGRDMRLAVFDRTKVVEGVLEALFPPIPSTGASNLCTLCYGDISDDESEAALWIHGLLCASPNLLHLSLETGRLPSLEGISWKRLETFEVSSLEFKDLFNIFMNCPALKRCAVSMYESEDPFIPTPNASEITLHYLHSFRMTEARQEDIVEVFKWLNLPSLKTLTLAGAEDFHPSNPWPPLPIADFLSRSRCRLQALALMNLPFEEDWLISTIRHSSVHDTLELLTFNFTSDPTSPLPSPFFPKLNNISIYINGISQPAPLKRLVASRWFDAGASDVPLPVACWKRIEIYFVVPPIPNGKVSIADSMRKRFQRISKTTELYLWDIFMDIRSAEEDLPGIRGVFQGIEDLNTLWFAEDTI
ncbi:hypothetical protein GYMLUDRAFT_237324 [Collybiopsis luxurians FD-317 M1]|nr:hypothetical protein GYMLUDRAFT_237324 [Collybiopsis luxurians FD-317 M1]